MTPNKSQEAQYYILSLLAASPAPMGANALHLALQDRYHLSRPTVGRILQTMDHRGLTERNKFAGRVITRQGRERLYRHLNESALRQGSEDLLKILAEVNKKRLLEVLDTRRALERETARLAADHITAAEVAALEASLRKHQEALVRGESAIEEDREFHRIIARASRNEVMEQVLEVIRTQNMVSPLTTVIRHRKSGPQLPEHARIIEAVKNHRPEEAQRAMEDHLTNLIIAVEAYLEEG